MAVRLSLPVNEIAVEAAVCSWIDLLAQEKYLEAYNFTLHDPYHTWTPALLEQVINGYGLPYEEGSISPRYKVTQWSTAISDSSKRYNEVEWHLPTVHAFNTFQSIGYVYYDLPIDGRWSDLTATFQILQATDYATLELNEIHVF